MTPMRNTDNIKLFTDRGIVTLSQASHDELYSARSHAWSTFFHNKNTLGKNEVGQRIKSRFGVSRNQLMDERRDLETRWKNELAIPQIEEEFVRRGIDPRDKNFTRVSSSVAYDALGFL